MNPEMKLEILYATAAALLAGILALPIILPSRANALENSFAVQMDSAETNDINIAAGI